MEDIIKHLRHFALEEAAGGKDEDYIIRGLWQLALFFSPDLQLHPNQNARIICHNLIFTKILGQGCCFCDSDPNVLTPELIGQDARTVIPGNRYVEIALLDGLFATHHTTPALTFQLDGYGVDKAVRRAEIVMNAVLEQTRRIRGRRPCVVNIGVVANFIRMLRLHNLEVRATDLESNLIGTFVNGIEVEHGERTLDLVAKSDVALVTGMTLVTCSLTQIINTAKQSGTKLILFAETGANFAEVYCKLFGIDTVISEPFPFYFFQGQSIIKVYKREMYS